MRFYFGKRVGCKRRRGLAVGTAGLLLTRWRFLTAIGYIHTFETAGAKNDLTDHFRPHRDLLAAP